MDEADRCDELLFMRSGSVIARGTGDELRERAGTTDLEQAFLHFAGDVRGDPVSWHRILAIFRRVTLEIVRDRPSLALLFVAPLVMSGLITFIIREGDSPTVDAVFVGAGTPAGSAGGRTDRGGHRAGPVGRSRSTTRPRHVPPSRMAAPASPSCWPRSLRPGRLPR